MVCYVYTARACAVASPRLSTSLALAVQEERVLKGRGALAADSSPLPETSFCHLYAERGRNPGDGSETRILVPPRHTKEVKEV